MASGVRARRVAGGRVLHGTPARLAAADVLVGADGSIEAVVDPSHPDDGRERVDARDRWVLPGLVNAHTHAYGQLTRDQVPRAGLEDWIAGSRAAGARLGPDGQALAAQLNAVDNLRHGVTTTLDHASLAPGELDAVVAAYGETGARVTLALQVGDRDGTTPATPGAAPASAAAALARARAAVDRVAGEARMRGAVGPSAPERCSDGLLDGLAALAAEHDLPVHVHLLETPAQAAHPDGGVGRLADHGLLGSRTTLAHAIHLDAADRGRIAASGACCVHDPVCNLLLGSGRADVVALRRAGIPVGLGTDGWSTGGAPDVLAQARVAVGLLRPDRDPADWLQPEELWDALTTDSALAAGLDGVVGLIEPGRRADLLLVDPVAAGWLASADPVLQLVWQGLGAGLRQVLVDGETVLADGRSTRLDDERLAHAAAHAQTTGPRAATEVHP